MQMISQNLSDWWMERVRWGWEVTHDSSCRERRVWGIDCEVAGVLVATVEIARKTTRSWNRLDLSAEISIRLLRPAISLGLKIDITVVLLATSIFWSSDMNIDAKINSGRKWHSGKNMLKSYGG